MEHLPKKDSNPVSRRDFLKQAAALTASVGIVSSLDRLTLVPDRVSAASAQVKKIQFYTEAWQPGAIKAAQDGINAFNKANTDVQVEYVQGDWGKAKDFITTSLAGGVAPEIIQGIAPWGIQYGQQGGYADLTPYLAKSDLKTDTDPRALDDATDPFTKKIYSLPFSWEVGVFFINADRFKEQGIAIPEKGWNWDEFLAAAKKLTKPPEYSGVAANLSATQTTEDLISWMWQTGAEVMGQVNGKWAIDLEPARAALSLWYDMIWQYNIVSPASLGAGEADLPAAFAVGKYSMVQTGCWARRIITEAKPKFQWRMVALPAQKRAATTDQTQTWAMASAAQERGTADAAWRVMEWMANKDNQIANALGDWLFPTRMSALADPVFSTTENDWNLAKAQVPSAKAYPKHPAWSEFDDRVLGPNIQSYLQKDMTLDDFIKKSTAEGEKLLVKYAPK